MLDPLRPLRSILRVFPLKRRNRHNNPIRELPIVTDDQRIPPKFSIAFTSRSFVGSSSSSTINYRKIKATFQVILPSKHRHVTRADGNWDVMKNR